MFDYPNIYIDKLIHNFKKYKDKEWWTNGIL
jgi:hypothetical protein